MHLKQVCSFQCGIKPMYNKIKHLRAINNKKHNRLNIRNERALLSRENFFRFSGNHVIETEISLYIDYFGNTLSSSKHEFEYLI